ncbi:hydroxyisourate hydrolase [Colletotrichum orchidophilum]|uniref:5-hydroxyisourate hydrolase n=1 Tax=Colletotrichum orchidophilum TaxID=1209926 RepID=A0A1G4BCJ5_9PEZI|nr:hydroxyisourate hydrolase [Colletotrichum orchidophilum]OHE99149.1 hydroxyisourate hydrolase [Colletotrichum orchidophilum]
MASPTKDRITCHVLDTSAGRPARNVRVQLSTTIPPPATTAGTGSPNAAAPAAGVLKEFESTTDEDGRVKSWLPFSSATSSGEVPVYTLDDVLGEIEAAATATTSSRWTLTFDTASYFGGEDETFFPEAVVVFTVKRGQHYHVPLLLSPYSYTTYRGS